MPLKVGIDMSLGDIKSQFGKIEEIGKQTALKTSKEFKEIEKALKKIPEATKAFKKEEAALQASLKKQLANKNLTEKQRQKLTQKTNKQIQAAYKKHFGQIENAQKKFAKQQEAIARRSADNQTGIVKGMSGKMKGLIGGIGLGMVFRMAKNALHEFAEEAKMVEERMAMIKTLFSPEQFKFLPEIEEMAKKTAAATGATVDEILRGAYQAISAGSAQAENAGQYMDQVARFAKSIGAGVEGSALAVGGVLNALGWAAEDAGRAMDVLAQTMKKGVIPSGEALAQYFPQFVPMMKKIGFSAEEMGAGLASMTGQGIQIDMATTSMNAFATAMSDVTTLQKLQTAGFVEGFDFQKREITDMTAFATSMTKTLAEDANLVLDAFGNIRAVKAVNALFSDTNKNLLGMKTHFEDVTGVSNEMWMAVANTSQRAAERSEQQMKAVEERAGKIWLGIETSFNKALISLFETSEDRMNAAIDNMNNYKMQAEVVGRILEKGFAIEIDYKQEDAESFFVNLQDRMESIRAISPLIAHNINEIINSAEGATPEGLRKVNEQLEIMQNRSERLARAEAYKAFEESMKAGLISWGSTVENISEGYEYWAQSYTGLAMGQASDMHDAMQKVVAMLALNREGLEASAQKANELGDAITKAWQYEEKMVTVTDMFGKTVTIGTEQANKLLQDWTAGIDLGNEKIEEHVTQILEISKGYSDIQTGVDLMIQELENNNKVSRTYIKQLKEVLQSKMDEALLAEKLGKIEEKLKDKMGDRINDVEELTKLYEEMVLQNLQLLKEIGLAAEAGQDVSAQIKKQTDLQIEILSIQGRINAAKERQRQTDENITKLTEEQSKALEDINKQIADVQYMTLTINLEGSEKAFADEKKRYEEHLEEIRDKYGNHYQLIEKAQELHEANVAKIQAEAAKKAADAMSSMADQIADARYAAATVGLEGVAKTLSDEQYRYEKHLEEIRAEYGEHYGLLQQAAELHEANVAKIQREESERFWKEAEEKKKEQEKKREAEWKKHQEELKKAEEERIRAIEQLNQYTYNRMKERTSAIEGFAQRATIFETFFQQYTTAKQAGTGYARVIDRLNESLNELVENPFYTDEDLLTRNFQEAALNYNNIIEFYAQKLEKMQEVELANSLRRQKIARNEAGIIVLPYDVQIEKERQILELQDVSLERLRQQANNLRANIKEHKDEVEVVKIYYDLLLQNQIRQNQINQHLEAIGIRHRYINDEYGKTVELNKLEYKYNLKNLQLLRQISMSQRTEADKEEIIRLEEENNRILGEIAQKYEDINQSASDFMNQRREGLNEEKTQIEQITQEYNNQLSILNEGIKELENRNSVDKSNVESLEQQINAARESLEIQQKLLKEKEATWLQDIEGETQLYNIVKQAREEREQAQKSFDAANNAVDFYQETLLNLPSAIERTRKEIQNLTGRQDAAGKYLLEQQQQILKEQEESLAFAREYINTSKATLEVKKEELRIAQENYDSILAQYNAISSNDELSKEGLEQIKASAAEQEKIVKDLEDQIQLARENIALNEVEQKELENMKQLQAEITELAQRELDIITQRQLTETRRKIAEIDMSGYERQRQAIKNNADTEIAEMWRGFQERMNLYKWGSEERIALYKEGAEAEFKLQKKKEEELLRLKLSHIMDIANKSLTVIKGAKDVISSIANFSASTTSSALAGISEVAGGLAGIANQFGPIGEMIGGALGIVSELFDLMASDEVTAMDKVIKRQRVEARITQEYQNQLDLMQTLTDLGDKRYNSAKEQLELIQQTQELLKQESSRRAEMSKWTEKEIYDNIKLHQDRISYYQYRLDTDSDLLQSQKDRFAANIKESEGLIALDKEELDWRKQTYDLEKQINEEKKRSIELMEQLALRANDYADALERSNKSLNMARSDLIKGLIADSSEFRKRFLGDMEVTDKELFAFLSNLSDETLELMGEDTKALIDEWLAAWETVGDAALQDTENLIELQRKIGDITDDEALQQLLDLYTQELARLESIGATDEEILEIRIKIKETEDEINDLYDEQAETLDLIQYELERIKHLYEMGELTEAEYNEQRLKLLQQQLDALDAQRAQMDESQGLTKEIWDIDKQRWQLEEEIYDILHKQTEEQLKQAGLDDDELEKLSKQRQMMIAMARESGKFKSPEVQIQLAKIEADIVNRMRELGVDESTIANAVAAMREQRSYMTGGEIPTTGPIYAHAGERITPEKASSLVNKIYPGFWETLRKATTLNQVEQAFITPTERLLPGLVQQIRTNEIMRSSNSTSNVTYNYNNGGNTIQQNIQGSGGMDQLATVIVNKIKPFLPDLIIEANRKAGLKMAR